MKLTNTQKKRLHELNAVKNRDEEQENEFLQLKSLAEAEDYDFSVADASLEEKSADEAGDGFTEAEAKKMIDDAVTKSFEGIGLDKDSIDAIKSGLNKETEIDASKIAEAVKNAVGNNINGEELAKTIKEQLPSDLVTEDKIKSLFDGLKQDFKENSRERSKMVHGGYQVTAGVEHRSGNLTVAAKQLLNLCMMHQDADALGDSKRPSDINEGISDSQISAAKANAKVHEKSMQHQALYGTKAGTGMATDSVGFGAELINVELATEIMNRLYLESPLAARLVSSEVDMPSNPYKFPLSTTLPEFYRGEENATPADSQAGTAEIILDAKKMIAVTPYSYEADEDAIVPMLGFLQARLATSASQSLENAFINGDDTGVHMDSDVTGANDKRKVWKGLRYYGQSVGALNTDLSTGGISAANVGALRKSMGKYGLNPADLVLIAGVGGYNDLVQLSETLTADLVGGNNARILTGLAPQIFGIPIITSAFMREDLNASGVYDGVTTTKGSIMLMHIPSWIVGKKRNFTLEVDRDIKAQCNWIVASFRRDFVPMETPTATESITALGYNYNA